MSGAVGVAAEPTTAGSSTAGLAGRATSFARHAAGSLATDLTPGAAGSLATGLAGGAAGSVATDRARGAVCVIEAACEASLQDSHVHRGSGNACSSWEIEREGLAAITISIDINNVRRQQRAAAGIDYG